MIEIDAPEPAEQRHHEAAGRRRGRRLLGAAACALALGVAGSAAIALTGDDDTDSTAQLPDYIRCGQPIPGPVLGSPLDGTGLVIESVVRDGGPEAPESPSPDAPPQVTYRIDVATPAPRNHTAIPPRVLVLKDGIVVGGPLSADLDLQVIDAGNFAEPAVGLRDGRKYHSWPVVETKRANAWLCGTTDWKRVWQDPRGYEIAVIMTPLTTGPPVGGPPDWTQGLGIPVIVARVPVANATR